MYGLRHNLQDLVIKSNKMPRTTKFLVPSYSNSVVDSHMNNVYTSPERSRFAPDKRNRVIRRGTVGSVLTEIIPLKFGPSLSPVMGPERPISSESNQGVFNIG